MSKTRASRAPKNSPLPDLLKIIWEEAKADPPLTPEQKRRLAVLLRVDSGGTR
jgi:hypothetical protein